MSKKINKRTNFFHWTKVNPFLDGGFDEYLSVIKKMVSDFVKSKGKEKMPQSLEEAYQDHWLKEYKDREGEYICDLKHPPAVHLVVEIWRTIREIESAEKNEDVRIACLDLGMLISRLFATGGGKSKSDMYYTARDFYKKQFAENGKSPSAKEVYLHLEKEGYTMPKLSSFPKTFSNWKNEKDEKGRKIWDLPEC